MESKFIVDADAHILEPGNLWEEYLEPKYRDRAMRFKIDENGLEHLEIDGQKSQTLQDGVPGYIGQCALPREVLEAHYKDLGQRAKSRWGQNDPPPAVDPHARIKWMDERGIDISVLYPTLGLNWEIECKDPELAAAYCRAYNNWLVDFCRPYPHRLIPAAHIPTGDVEESVKELKRMAGLGAKGTYLFAAPSNGKSYEDSYWDPLWAEAEHLQIPISVHVCFHADYIGSHLHPAGMFKGGWFYFLMNCGDVLLAFTSLFSGGVFDRFPRLKVVVLEVGCGWVAYWLERMDSAFDFVGFTTPMKMKPSEYFQRQCWVSVEPDEKLVPTMAQLVGADKLVWSSDYPHVEAEAEALDEAMEILRALPETDQQKILSENARKLYNLS